MGKLQTDSPTFTASEAAKLTGVSMVTQRNWRRLGILPAIDERRAAFDLRGIAFLQLMNMLARSSGVEVSLNTAKSAAEALAPELADCLAGGEGTSSTAVVWASGDVSVHPDMQAAAASGWREQLVGGVFMVPLEMIGQPLHIKVRDFLAARESGS